MKATQKFFLFFALAMLSLFAQLHGATPSKQPICAPNCTPPQNLHPTNITTTTISLTWDQVPSNKGYRISYKNLSVTPTVVQTIDLPKNTNSATIPALTPGTNYEIWAQTKCNNGNFSAFSNKITVRTLSIVDEDVIMLQVPPNNPCGNTVTPVNNSVSWNNGEIFWIELIKQNSPSISFYIYRDALGNIHAPKNIKPNGVICANNPVSDFPSGDATNSQIVIRGTSTALILVNSSNFRVIATGYSFGTIKKTSY